MNPMQILQQIMKAPNKMSMVENLINQNPQLKGVWELFKTGDVKLLESQVKEMFSKNGRDFDKEFSEFMNNFK